MSLYKNDLLGGSVLEVNICNVFLIHLELMHKLF